MEPPHRRVTHQEEHDDADSQCVPTDPEQDRRSHAGATRGVGRCAASNRRRRPSRQWAAAARAAAPDTATPGKSRCARSLCRRQRRARCYSRRSSSAPAPSPVAIKTSSSWSGSATCLSKWFAPQVTPRHCRVTPDQERPGEAITLHRRRARAAGKMRSRVSVTSAASAECPSLMSPGPISTPVERMIWFAHRRHSPTNVARSTVAEVVLPHFGRNRPCGSDDHVRRPTLGCQHRTRWFHPSLRGNDCRMDESKNVAGTRLTCTNADCDCELQINTPCPHGTTYTCACGHAFEPVA